VYEHQAAFMNSLREGRAMRERIFDTIEKRHAHDFGNGRLGKGFYEDLLSAVRDSGAPGAAEEFEKRFLPYLNPDRARSKPDTLEDRSRGGWGLASVLCVSAVLGAVIVGFTAFKMTASERLAVTQAPIPVAKAKEPTSAAITESAPATMAETPIPAGKVEEPASETMAESTASMAPESSTSAAKTTEPASEATTEPAPAMDVEE
jgi:hypothetical protein